MFFRLKDLLHTTQRQNALLSEQGQLQKDISKWIARFESCQKETETKEQQLQELQNEIRESKLQLDQQEMVLHRKGGVLHFIGASCLPPPKPRSDCPVCISWVTDSSLNYRLFSLRHWSCKDLNGHMLIN